MSSIDQGIYLMANQGWYESYLSAGEKIFLNTEGAGLTACPLTAVAFSGKRTSQLSYENQLKWWTLTSFFSRFYSQLI